MKKTVFIVTILSLIGLGCGKEDVDTASPTLQFGQLSPNPTTGTVCGSTEPNVFHLQSGEDLELSMTFQDDQALSQYKIDIHNNFDCHGHGGASAPGVNVPNVNNQTEDWSILDIVNLSGTSQQVNVTLPVPQNVTPGNYHFQIQVIDESGNDNGQGNIYSLIITNPIDDIAPVIDATEPMGPLTLSKGSDITFKGTVTDNHSLSDGGNGLLFVSYTDLSSGNTFTTDAVFTFDQSVDKTFDFDFQYTVPVTLTNGEYLFSLRAHDGLRNVAAPVHVNVTVTN